MPAGLRVGLLSPGQTKAICSRVEGCRTSVLASRVGGTEGRLLLGIVGGCCMWVGLVSLSHGAYVANR